MTVDPFARLDGAYVLGALSPEDRAAFEAHVSGCVRCRTAVSDLAGLPGLLARTDPSRLHATEAGPPMPETLLPALLMAERRERRRQRLRIAVAGAALVAAVSVAAGPLLWDDGPETAATQTSGAVEMLALSPLGEPGLDASVGLEPVAWGTRVTLTCRYPPAAAVYDDQGAAQYVLVVRNSDGGEQPVATWVGVPGAAMTVTGGTAWRADDIVDVEVRTSAGRPLLSLNG